MTKPLILVSAALLIDPEKRILLTQRPEGKSMAGLWEFPGGKVEAGESPETALIRELEEELGIIVSESELTPVTFASHAYDHFHLMMPLFACYRWQGTLRLLEHQAMEWVPPDALETHPMPPADIPLIHSIRQFMKDLSFTTTMAG